MLKCAADLLTFNSVNQFGDFSWLWDAYFIVMLHKEVDLIEHFIITVINIVYQQK